MKHLSRVLHRHEFYLAATLALLASIIAPVNPAFLSLSNLFDLCKSSTVLGLFALGVLVVLLSGGIDISFTAIAALSMYVTSKVLLAVGYSGSVIVAFIMAGCLGLLLGLFNAFFISCFRLPTLIVTLGSASVFRGFLLAFIGTKIVTSLPAGMVEFSKRSVFTATLPGGETIGLSASFLLFVAAAVMVWVMLRYTMPGKGIYGLGGNPEATERAGFRIIRSAVLSLNIDGEAVIAGAKAEVFPGTIFDGGIAVEQRAFESGDFEIHGIDTRGQVELANQEKIRTQRERWEGQGDVRALGADTPAGGFPVKTCFQRHGIET